MNLHSLVDYSSTVVLHTVEEILSLSVVGTCWDSTHGEWWVMLDFSPGHLVLIPLNIDSGLLLVIMFLLTNLAGHGLYNYPSSSTYICNILLSIINCYRVTLTSHHVPPFFSSL